MEDSGTVLIEHLDFALTVDDADTVLTDVSLLVRDGRIADLGPAAEVRSGCPAVNRIG